MLIGIDASRALRPTVTGTERYSREIITPSACNCPRPVRTPGDSTPTRCRSRDASRRPRQTQHPTRPTTSRSAPCPHAACGAIRPSVRRSCAIGRTCSSCPATSFPSRRFRRGCRPTVVTVHDLGYHALPDSHTLRQRQYLTWSTRWSASVSATRHRGEPSHGRRRAAPLCQRRRTRCRVVYEAAYAWQPAHRRGDSICASRSTTCTDPTRSTSGTIQPRKNVARMIQAYTALAKEHSLAVGLGACRQRRLAQRTDLRPGAQ